MQQQLVHTASLDRYLPEHADSSKGNKATDVATSSELLTQVILSSPGGSKTPATRSIVSYLNRS